MYYDGNQSPYTEWSNKTWLLLSITNKTSYTHLFLSSYLEKKNFM